jgi:hypothetical protein
MRRGLRRRLLLRRNEVRIVLLGHLLLLGRRL